MGNASKKQNEKLQNIYSKLFVVGSGGKSGKL